MIKNPNKAKHKARRKALAKAELIKGLKAKKTIEAWVKEWYESRPDYPTSVIGEKRKKLSWVKEFRRLLKAKQK